MIPGKKLIGWKRPTCPETPYRILPECSWKLYVSQKQLPRKMMTRLVIIECAGYALRQLFLWRL